ncbi:MAG: DNA-processing protein DprA [Solirubrobacteraceae bacterium]
MSELGGACDACLARTWLLARLSGHLEVERARIWELLALGDERLIKAVAGGQHAAVLAERNAFGPRQARTARRRAQEARLELICRCTDAYPEELRALEAPPHVIHVAGGMARLRRFCAGDPVALVGARRASGYGQEVARSVARGLAVTGITVLSGMATGVDASAHRGALEGQGATLAVLPGPAERPYPVANASLYRKLVRDGVVIAEVGPGVPVRRWMFAARNRLIAGLSRLIVVVQAAAGSGSLLTVEAARRAGRPVAAVPGAVTSRLSDEPNRLLAEGAVLIRDAQDVLDALFGVGARHAADDLRDRPSPAGLALLAAVGEGVNTSAALMAAQIAGDGCLAELAALEISGHLRRGPGGRFSARP